MGTLTLTEPMEGHKQLIPLLLLSLSRTAVQAQNCWQCLGTGSDINACAVPGNGTMQVPIPEQAYLTSDLANICMTRVVFDISACPKEGNCQNTAVLEQVSRGLPQLELEYQMFKSNEQATNATGVCTSNGALMTCTTLCEGDLCNSNTVSASLTAYTETVTTKCILCQQIAGSDNFNDCLMGNNTNYTQICAGSDEGVGNNLLAGMCVTIVNYDNSTLAPASVYRGCGIPPQSVIYPTGEVEYSTLGQCSETEISYNGNVVPTWSCVKGYVQDIETSEGSYIANYNRAAPGPMNATCLQCNAVMGDMQFDACMNPNATASSADLAGMGVGMSVCGCGANACMSATMYNANATVVGVQRGCGNAPGTASQDVCNYSDPSDLDTSDIICTSQCTASSMPCNDYNNAYTPNATPVSASVLVSLSAVLLMISMML